MKISPVIELLNSLPPKFQKGVEYYYRRGKRFFFRTPDKKEKITILCSPGHAEECKKILIRGKVYGCVMN